MPRNLATLPRKTARRMDLKRINYSEIILVQQLPWLADLMIPDSKHCRIRISGSKITIIVASKVFFCKIGKLAQPIT